ncbi:fungal-specific transcription factor domain-containing protein [Xylariaceae sp. FL1019]|nr:fungal-specific transcription factor domain-containing protein [Xylariaceae sp. FL1019]
MERSRRAWLSSGARACSNCQKRKSRCLRARPGDTSCIYCTKTRKTCVFESPPSRTPLTRRNLDAAELQVKQLRALLSSLHPDLDIDAARVRLGSCDSNEHTLGQFDSSPADTDKPTPQKYEWHEGTLSTDTEPVANGSSSNDGMGNLSTKTNSGYLGGSAGSHLLEEIASAISINGKQRRASEGQPRRPSTKSTSDAPFDQFIELSTTARRLIDNYFLHYNSCYPILHEKSFRESIEDPRLRHSAAPWRVVFYMVLAIGDWVSAPESKSTLSPYYHAARSCLSFQTLESGTTETVQAFLLMGNYLQKRDRPNTGYNFVGLALKLGIGLGLHRELSDDNDTFDNERRRSLFWTMVCFENGFSITTGRPPTLFDGFIDTRVPRNINDEDLSFDSLVPPEVEHPTTSSAIIAQAHLTRVGDAVYQEFMLAKTAGTKIEYRVAEMMERRFDDWRRDLPRYFISTEVPAWFLASRAILLWREQNIRLLLWRGSQEYHSFLPNKQSAETKCLDVAMQTIHEISSFCADHPSALHPGFTWYCTYYVFQAALVIEASYLQDAKKQRLESDNSGRQHSLFQSRACLNTLAQFSKSATRCNEVLGSIQDRLHQPAETLPMSSETAIGRDAYSAMPQAPNTGFMGGDSDYTYLGNGFGGFGDDIVDPTLRMFINPTTSTDTFGDMPLNMLLDTWMA